MGIKPIDVAFRNTRKPRQLFWPSFYASALKIVGEIPGCSPQVMWTINTEEKKMEYEELVKIAAKEIIGGAYYWDYVRVLTSKRGLGDSSLDEASVLRNLSYALVVEGADERIVTDINRTIDFMVDSYCPGVG